MMESNEARSCPAEVLDWIAWYPHGEVPEDVRGSIEAHAAECAACREEIGLVTGEAAVVEDLPPGDRVFARVLQRIAEDDADIGATSVPSLDAARAERRGAAPPSRRGISIPQALAAGIALVCISWVGGWLAAGTDVAEASPYAVAAEPSGATAEGVFLDVVFRGEIPFGRVQETLRRIDATVVAGPSRAGVVRIRLPAGTPPEAVATQLREGEDPVAIFAEPVQDS